MYLTKEELTILQGLKNGLNFAEINQELETPIRTCDPRIDSLCLKYGVDDRTELIRKADLNKITVANIEEIPYWKYEGNQLVQILPICKKALKNIMELLEQEKDDKIEFELIYSSNKLNKFLLLKKGEEKFYIYRAKPVYLLSRQKPI